MRVDEETGEILEVYTVGYEHSKEEVKEPYDKSKVMCKKDVEDYFRDENYNKRIKVRWTNWAIDDLLDSGEQVAYRFKLLSELIIARNIVFETTDSLREHLGLSESRFKSVMKQMKDLSLIREYKGHSGTRKWRYLELNPTLVFKTYQGKSDEKDYGSGSRFNSLHQFYVDKWIEEGIGKSPYTYKE